MFKPFIIHYNPHRPGKRPNNHAIRGYTAYIQPATGDSRSCVVSVALCSPKDQFCKKLGRETALGAVQQTINKRDLPRVLVDLDNKCHGFTWTTGRTYARDYVLKYVI